MLASLLIVGRETLSLAPPDKATKFDLERPRRGRLAIYLFAATERVDLMVRYSFVRSLFFGLWVSLLVDDAHIRHLYYRFPVASLRSLGCGYVFRVSSSGLRPVLVRARGGLSRRERFVLCGARPWPRGFCRLVWRTGAGESGGFADALSVAAPMPECWWLRWRTL